MKIHTPQKKFLVSAAVTVPIILLLIFAGIYLNLSGTFRDAPKVETQPLNTFEKTLHVVTDRDYAPYSYVDADGNYQGYDVELINEIANRLRMNLDLTLADWDSANKIFLNGDADIIMNIESDLIINNPRMIATLPTTEKQYVIYGRKKISSVAELYDSKIASLHDMPGLGLDDEINYVGNYRKIFNGLKSGKYDFAICPIQVGNTFVDTLKIDGVFPSYAVQHVYGTLALHPTGNLLRLKINNILIQMQEEGRLSELDKKWIIDRYENITLGEMILSRPWLSSMILVSVLFVLLLIVYTVMQIRWTHSREEYTRQLQEHYDTIKFQDEELKSRQRELIAAKERAEESSKAKSTFLSNMSHDIRTPMNAIIGYLNLAKDLHKTCENCPMYKKEPCPDDVPDRMYTFLEKISASSEHLLALINDVLEMSRIESGKMELELVDTNIVAAMDEVRDMFATQMTGKKISFTVTAEVTDKFIMCDKNRLDRVLLNLLSNAYKFTPEGGTINVKLKQVGQSYDGTGDYELRVKDSGIGMTPEFAAKVFEAFERERTSTVSGIQGTGLGMAITKSIVDLMGGTIRVETEKGKGTEFIINVAFKLAEEMREDVADENQQAAQIIKFIGKKLLLVDDIDINREIAKMLLEGAGFVVDTAVDGQDAVEKISNSKPGEYDAVLMDIQMPIMNGYEAAKKIRALDDSKLAKIPIIAMTANAFSEDVKAALDAGMNAHIAKPIDIPNMMSTLAKVLP